MEPLEEKRILRNIIDKYRVLSRKACLRLFLGTCCLPKTAKVITWPKIQTLKNVGLQPTRFSGFGGKS